MQKKEIRGIYNVTFNEKKATPLKTDIELIEEAIIAEVIYYVRGWHNIKRDKGRGAEHIRFHLEPNSEGQITLEELVNLGNSIREYLKGFEEPFKDSNDAKVYEWQNKEGVRFRLVTDTNHKQITKGEGHSNTPLSPFGETIMTFYSDRNLKTQIRKPQSPHKNPPKSTDNETIHRRKTRISKGDCRGN